MRLRDAQAVYDRYPALKSDGVIYASVAQVVADLEQQLAQATERERIAAAAYDGQQSSQRELEALYQAAVERAERAENRQRDMVTALLHAYVRLFPTFEFVSYEQALAVIEREWGAVYARLSAPIVCLCGSTRFYDAFQRANYEETMAGRIVLSVGFYPHSAEQAHGESVGCTPEQKRQLDALHLCKIDLADEVLVLNVGGYVGESTAREIAYARRLGKPIRWLEQGGML